MKFKSATILAASIILAAPVIAQASSEQANIFGFPTGYLKINPATCKFATPERDVKPNAQERYARAEDLRDDVLFACIRKLAVKANQPQPPTLSVDHGWDNPVTALNEAQPDKQGFRDETGAKALRDYIAAVRACEQAR